MCGASHARGFGRANPKGRLKNALCGFQTASCRFRHAEPAVGWVLTHYFRRYFRLCRIKKNGGSRPTLRNRVFRRPFVPHIGNRVRGCATHPT
ncbi:hypothetical protein HMPREF9123_2020 [Neisseria bacilliformis ATCC BAA-1200]|uniref:Uncharacterized protein n=1 Tax=Neisseria bacilliformis ATCC BAA-1200 TaxID=888742 RepID=F2BE64_9NEIS|nr:hypothetical protein HMPREF9123_2020 [Neisseria bacilliformis ATCC BAA-1200]